MQRLSSSFDYSKSVRNRSQLLIPAAGDKSSTVKKKKKKKERKKKTSREKEGEGGRNIGRKWKSEQTSWGRKKMWWEKRGWEGKRGATFDSI